jgi:hypothetical protein
MSRIAGLGAGARVFLGHRDPEWVTRIAGRRVG